MKSQSIQTLRHVACTLAFLLAAFFGSLPGLPAQQSHSVSNLEAKQVSLTVTDAPLSAILQTLSEQTGYGILVDGEPLLTKANFDLHTSAKDALDKVAERFDLSWSLSKRGAVLMNKRFIVAGDLPQMDLADMQQMAADLLRIWPAAPSEVRFHYYPFTRVTIYPVNALARTFTARQQQVLQSGQALTYQDLTPEQQSLVRLCVVNGAAGTSRDAWEVLNARLTEMPHATLQWRPWNPDHPDPLGYSLDYIWPDPQNQGFARLLELPTVNRMREKGHE